MSSFASEVTGRGEAKPAPQQLAAKPLRVLVLGGSGVFGSRIARLLAGTPNLQIVIGGRSIERAEKTAREIAAATLDTNLSALSVDRSEALASRLADAEIGLLINAAGPFQDQDYDVARAALAAGAHYLDLAEDARFVTGFARLDKPARAAGLTLLTGLSSVPALTSAVIAALAGDLAQVVEIRSGISPEGRARLGSAVVEGVLSGVGQMSEQRKGGAWIALRGWRDLHLRTVRVAGKKPLRRWFSHVEVSDPYCLAKHYPAADTITFHAGLQNWALHLGLWALSWAVEWGLVSNLAHHAASLERIAALLRPIGSDRGTMFVEVVGRDKTGAWVKRTWSLQAGHGDGPTIPAIPAALVAKAIAAGNTPPAGARAALGTLPLAALEEAFAAFDIATERKEERLPAPLYERALGEGFAALPAKIREIHRRRTARLFEGMAKVQRGTSPLSFLIGAFLRLPLRAQSTPVSVMIEPLGKGERWKRIFGTRSFSTTVERDEDRSDALLRERFGLFAFEMHPEASGTALTMKPVAVRLCGFRLPKSLTPRVASQERIEADRFTFDVRIELPVAGLLVHYTGWLAPSEGLVPTLSQRDGPERKDADEAELTWPR